MKLSKKRYLIGFTAVVLVLAGVRWCFPQVAEGEKVRKGESEKVSEAHPLTFSLSPPLTFSPLLSATCGNAAFTAASSRTTAIKLIKYRFFESFIYFFCFALQRYKDFL